MGRETLPKVRDGSGGPLKGLERVGRYSRGSGTCRGTLPVGLKRVEKTFGRSETGWGGPPKGPGWVRGPPWRSRIGRVLLP